MITPPLFDKDESCQPTTNTVLMSIYEGRLNHWFTGQWIET